MEERILAVPTRLSELADLVQGRLVGDGAILIRGASPLGKAQAGDIAFVENAKNLDQLACCPAAALVVPADCQVDSIPNVQVADPLTAFVAIVHHFRGARLDGPQGVDPRAAVDATAQVGAETNVAAFATIGPQSRLGKRCRIHAGAVVGPRCTLGDDVVLYPGAVLYEGTVLGNRVTIHANSVVGGDGFGYRPKDGRHAKVPHLGHVEIGDDVEIGACTTIDRGTFEATRIGNGTKIDNLVQIAHNCQIGQHNLVVSQVGIAGSSSTGDFVVLAGQVGIVDHAHIGTGAMIGAQAGVTKSVPAGQRMLGSPATPEREQKRILMTMEKLPEIRRDLKRIKQHLGLADESAA
jgi:UDP-3-O-[3-hydroxymyristoyl] glucosamine N-acyltransferase